VGCSARRPVLKFGYYLKGSHLALLIIIRFLRFSPVWIIASYYSFYEGSSWISKVNLALENTNSDEYESSRKTRHKSDNLSEKHRSNYKSDGAKKKKYDGNGNWTD